MAGGRTLPSGKTGMISTLTPAAMGASTAVWAAAKCEASDAARPWLQHLVFAFSGNEMHIYVNGEEKGKGALRGMYPAQWLANAVLLLGNSADGHTSYLGSYYLAAIHNRCLSLLEIRRNYQAGPHAEC